jgi:hypothetical protein
MCFILIGQDATKAGCYHLDKKLRELNSKMKKTDLCQEVIHKTSKSRL